MNEPEIDVVSGSTPGGTTPGGSTPGGTTPGDATPGGSTPGGSTPGGSSPGGSGGSVPGGSGGGSPGICNSSLMLELKSSVKYTHTFAKHSGYHSETCNFRSNEDDAIEHLSQALIVPGKCYDLTLTDRYIGTLLAREDTALT